MKITIDTDICFECGEPSGEMHHVIPKVRGGTRTIPLCVECHCKVHGLKNRPEHKRLTIEGLQKAKARGVKLGKPENLTSKAQQRGVENIKLNAINNPNNKKALEVIIVQRNNDKTYSYIADLLNYMGYLTRYGKQYRPVTVYRLYERYSKNLVN